MPCGEGERGLVVVGILLLLGFLLLWPILLSLNIDQGGALASWTAVWTPLWIMELFVAGRHYRLFVLITTQYAKAITPTLRGNTDYCFMMKCLQQRQLESLKLRQLGLRPPQQRRQRRQQPQQRNTRRLPRLLHILGLARTPTEQTRKLTLQKQHPRRQL